MSTDLERIGKAVEGHACKLPDELAKELGQEELLLAKAYAADYCRPWLKLWDGVLSRCDADRPPAWCDDEAAVLTRLDLDGYFATLVRGMPTAPQLGRDNVLDVAMAAFHAHAINDFGSEPPDRWAASVATAYLGTATIDEAVVVASGFQHTWVGITPGVRAAFKNYLDRIGSDAGDRRQELESPMAVRFANR
jgi:hypothetical protein